MSEFTCRNGHLMRTGQLRCEDCGAPLHAMDGMTDKQIRKQERRHRRQSEIESDYYDGT